jgi:phosphoribosylanthranilate isomerase
MLHRTRVKICCISSVDEAALATTYGADAIGLVGSMPSGPGIISDQLIAHIAAQVPPPIGTFLLTCEIKADAIAAHQARTGANTLQVVQHIDPLESKKLRELLPQVRIVQVIHVEDQGALELLNAYSPYVHAILLDSGRPSALTPELGGTGRVHDWDVSAKLVQMSRRPVFLAGGLTSENVGQAIEKVQPYGLDLCSSLRTEGALDATKLRQFMAAVARADAAASPKRLSNAS